MQQHPQDSRDGDIVGDPSASSSETTTTSSHVVVSESSSSSNGERNPPAVEVEEEEKEQQDRQISLEGHTGARPSSSSSSSSSRIATDANELGQSFTSSVQDSSLLSGETLNTTQEESYETAIQSEDEAVFPMARSIAAGRINQNNSSYDNNSNNNNGDYDVQSVNSDTAVNGRQTQQEQLTTDHSVIYGTYDSPINTSELEEDEDEEEDDELLLDTSSNNSSVQLPGTDEEEYEIIFEEPASPDASEYSGVFGSGLWNVQPLSFDMTSGNPLSSDPHNKPPPPSSPSSSPLDHREDRRVWFWRKKRSTSTNKPKSKPHLSLLDPEPTNPPSTAELPTAVSSPTRTVATDGTTSGLDTPMLRGRRHRRRRRRLFPRLTHQNDSTDDDNHDFIEIVTTDEENDDVERGTRSARSNLLRSKSSRYSKSKGSTLSRSEPSRSDYHSKAQTTRTDPKGSSMEFVNGSTHPRTATSLSRSQRKGSVDPTRSDHDRLDDHDRSDDHVRSIHSRSDRSVSPDMSIESINDTPMQNPNAAPTRQSTNQRVEQPDYQLLSFYRLLCLGCLFVALIIASSVITSFWGAMLALEAQGNDNTSNDRPPTIENDNNETGQTENGTSGINNTTNVIVSPCGNASAWLELSLKFDARPAETSIFLVGSGIFGSAVVPLWDFPKSTFRSFTQFQRTNVFGICLSKTATYHLTIGDSAADGLVSKLLVVSGFATTIVYGKWEISLDGVQKAVYHGDCSMLPLNKNTDVANMQHCGSYCKCEYSVSSISNWTGGCNEFCN